MAHRVTEELVDQARRAATAQTEINALEYMLAVAKDWSDYDLTGNTEGVVDDVISRLEAELTHWRDQRQEALELLHSEVRGGGIQ